ncbi:MAG: radical SAM protein [Candidatus Methylarchaceae archaeon HK01B]|nr:radical SAM protein [Candidatus Methylarchaceae archaeon HK01B]
MWRAFRPDSITVLYDKKCRASLSRYLDIILDKKMAKFKLLKTFSSDFQAKSTAEMWNLHDKMVEDFKDYVKEVDSGREVDLADRSLLDLKISLAKKILERCTFCMHACAVNRLRGETRYCGCSMDFPVSTMFDHYGEEPELVPSFTVFTLGCSMRCIHCQNWTISQWKERGTLYELEEVAMQADKARLRGCRNLNMVGGEPTPYLYHWLEVSRLIKENMPIVWNSNSFYSIPSSRLLAEWVDVYLLDFKYGNNDCAVRISDAPKYWETCTRNHLMAKEYGELIIRVLVLPDHIDCCFRPIVEWIAKNLGSDTRVNVMWQYTPHWRAHEIPELRRRLKREEMERTTRIAKEVGLENFIT